MTVLGGEPLHQEQKNTNSKTLDVLFLVTNERGSVESSGLN